MSAYFNASVVTPVSDSLGAGLGSGVALMVVQLAVVVCMTIGALALVSERKP